MRIIAIVGALGLAAVASAAGPGLMPGLYKVVETGDDASTSKHCITPNDVAKTSLLGNLPKQCTIGQNTSAGGKVALSYTCPGMSGSATGSYTATSYTMNTKYRVSMGGKAMSGTKHAVATRIGAVCTPDAD